MGVTAEDVRNAIRHPRPLAAWRRRIVNWMGWGFSGLTFVLLGGAMVSAAAGLASMAHLTATSTWLVLLPGFILAQRVYQAGGHPGVGWLHRRKRR